MSSRFHSELRSVQQVTYRRDNQELLLALSVECLTTFCNIDDRMLIACNSAAVCRYSSNKDLYVYTGRQVLPVSDVCAESTACFESRTTPTEVLSELRGIVCEPELDKLPKAEWCSVSKIVWQYIPPQLYKTRLYTQRLSLNCIKLHWKMLENEN